MNYMFLTAAGAAGGTSNAVITLVMLIGMIAIFYFFMYRPQKKQEKETKNMLDALEVGDEITTIGGIIGKIVSMKDETVLIETSNERNKIRILRSAVRNVDVHAADAD